MVLDLGRGRRGLFVVFVVVVGAKDVPGVIGSMSSSALGASGLGVVLCLGCFERLGCGRRVLGRCDVFEATVAWGASVLRITGSISVAGTIVGTESSGCTVAGSRAGLDLGTSGLGEVLGRGRRGRLVFGRANVVVEGLVPSVPGSTTIVDCDGGRV